MPHPVIAAGLAATLLVVAGSVAHAAPVGAGVAGLRPDVASWYGPWFEGRLMANGHPFHAGRFTAASRTLPIGAMVRVRNLRNGRAVLVEITDRGPYIDGRTIDLSRAAAERLGMVEDGVVTVSVVPVTTQATGPMVR